MAPEYGATMGFFPGRRRNAATICASPTAPPDLVALVEAYAKEQGLFRTDQTPDPLFSDTLELDLATVVPSMAGPKRPQDRVNLPQVKSNFQSAFPAAPHKKVAIQTNGTKSEIDNGAVVIAAITSCTNTSNPSVMIGAGLLAKKAVERGLKSKPWVKTSLAPGSKVVTDYLDEAGPDAVSRAAELPSGRLWLHHLHRQQRPAAGAGRRRRCRRKTWWSPPCSAAIAISKAASTRR